MNMELVGRIIGIVSLTAILGMLVIPIIPHLRFKVETLGGVDKKGKDETKPAHRSKYAEKKKKKKK